MAFFNQALNWGRGENCKSAAKAKESPEKVLGITSCGESLPARLNLEKGRKESYNLLSLWKMEKKG